MPAARRKTFSRAGRDPRWDAVIARDCLADGRFFYAVMTTGVYCRPSCPARRPKPENVRFFTTRTAAEQAGFRPCRRCRPDEPSLRGRHAETVVRLCRLIEESEALPTLDYLARRAGMSPAHVHRVFRAVTGLTPKGYADACVRSACVPRLSGQIQSWTRSLLRATVPAAGFTSDRQTFWE